MISPGTRWIPIDGEETKGLLERLRLSPESCLTLREEATAILARCVPPLATRRHETGLVIGYVQSGKTMSFTTVSALARDNGYRLIIVLSGLTLNLFKQSRDRLQEDLQTDEGRTRWLAFDNPKDQAHVRDAITIALGTEHRTVLLTVMKNRSHLDRLKRLLEKLPHAGVPALVIDDEADQASLNNDVRKGGQSATYRRVTELRRLLPHHTYLQYTATPQAPLLINLIDVLSPRFVRVLTPGSAYTGGKVFFGGELDLVRPIHPREVPSRNNYIDQPPDSMLDALRVYFLGVAVGRLSGRDNQGENRSMMIHPSMERSPHANYQAWVREVKRGWIKLLTVGRANPLDNDYLELVEEFRQAHADLVRTVQDLPPLAALFEHLQDAMSQTMVVEMNTRQGQTPEINWRQHYAHILVGGEVLNRGFTVEGLTVTYMPRSLGMGQADTIEQRARWFGYKEEYLGLCRVWLTNEAHSAYSNYVEHEENMRQQLREFATTGRPLSEWKRAFFLSRALQATRRIVLDLEYARGNFANSWFRPNAPHDSEDAIRNNRDAVVRFTSAHQEWFGQDQGDPRRTEDQLHLVAQGLSLQKVYREFLVKLLYTEPDDSARFTGLLLQIDRHLENHPDEECVVYQMKSGRIRARGLDGKGRIDNLFQGYYPIGALSPSDRIYPGDDKIRVADRLTIQLHRLDLTQDGKIVANDILAAAVWVPRRMSAAWISQHQRPA